MVSARDELIQSAGIDLATRSDLTEGVTVYSVSGGKAVAAWHRLRESSLQLGCWPVILGSDENLGYIREGVEGQGLDERRKLLLEVPLGDPVIARHLAMREMRRRMLEFFNTKLPDAPAVLRQYLESSVGKEPDVRCPEIPLHLVAWSKTASPAMRLVESVNDILKRKPLDMCYLALVDVSEPSDALAVLAFGGFNDCPQPAVQVAFMRDWNARFGAIPICVTHNVVELWVPRPPQTAEDTWHVAWEMEEYCSDIVSQGTRTLEALFQEIWKSNYWYFWWD